MRLTQNLRKEIIRNAMAVRFDKLQKALFAEEKALGLKVYDHFVTPKIAAAIKTLDDSGMVFFNNRQTVLTVDVNHYKHDLHFDGAARVMPHNWARGFSLSVRDAGAAGALAKEVEMFDRKRKDFYEERKKAEVQLTALLKSVFSTETLAKVWPEGAKLYSSPPLPKVMAGLPAVQIAELNKMIGLDKAA